MQIDPILLKPIYTQELSMWRQHRSHIFEDYFDPAIIGTALNAYGRRVIVYLEEKLIELAFFRLRLHSEDPEEILWEDGAMFISDGLDLTLDQLGSGAPIIA